MAINNLKINMVYAELEFDLDLRDLDKRLDTAQETLINQIKEDTEKYVPAKSLDLTNSAHPENYNQELVWSGPYARFQYGGKVMTDERGRTWVGKGEKKPIVTNRNLVYTKNIHPQASDHWYAEAEKRHKNEWIKKVKSVIKNGK